MCLQVLDHDIDEDELRDVLLEAMHNMLDAPVGDEDETKCSSASGSAVLGFFARKLKPKGSSAKLSSEELEAAAHWLVERFGQEADDESDDEDSGNDDDNVDAAAQDEVEVNSFFLFLCLIFFMFSISAGRLHRSEPGMHGFDTSGVTVLVQANKFWRLWWSLVPVHFVS
jgi:hypothetical protein